MKVLSLDPGITTGIVIYNDEVDNYPPWSFKYDQIEDDRNLWCIWDILSTVRPEVIVYEKFTYQIRDKVELHPVQVIGVIRLYAEQFKVPIFGQFASLVIGPKGFWNDKKIKQIGLWKPGMKHAMDALRHYLYWSTFTDKSQRWINELRTKS